MSKDSVYKEYKFWANIYIWNKYFVVFGSFIFLCITLYLDYNAYRINKRYNPIIGKIKNSTCKNNRIKFDCSLNILYKIENKEYQNELRSYYGINYKPDDSINIRYKKQNKNKIVFNEEAFIGWTIFGILGVLGSVFNLLILNNYYKRIFN